MKRFTVWGAGLLLAGCATSTGEPAPIDAGMDAQADASDPTFAPVIERVDPPEGPSAGGTLVTLTGQNFEAGATATFGGAAADCTEVEPFRMRCTTTAHEAGAVEVIVTSPDGRQGFLPGGFVYVGEPVSPITWAVLDHPASLSVRATRDSEPVAGRVRIPGVTGLAGASPGLAAELGWGADAALPETFTWQQAAHVRDVGSDDEFTAVLNIGVPGEFAYAFRFRADDGSGWVLADLDGGPYSADQAGRVTVTPLPEGLFLESIEPPFGAVIGGERVTIVGQDLDPAAIVLIDGVQATEVAVAADGASLVATTPAHVGAAVDVTVQNPDGAVASLPAGFEYVYWATPVVDGEVQDDWPAGYVLGEEDTATDWGVGLNELRSLRVAYDADFLYVGVDGICEATNAIVVYLDVDYGAGSGVRDMTNLSDDTGALDLALGSPVDIEPGGFGADWGAGSRGMAEVGVDGLSDDAGWRLLVNWVDLGWFEGQVATGTAVELAIPRATLWPGGVPDGGVTLALFARLVSQDGALLSNQTLPQDDPEAPAAVSTFATLRIR